MPAQCSCGNAEPHVIARRRTFDGKDVCLWDDGTLTWAFGFAVKGAWFKPSEANRDRALAAGWLVLGEVEIYDACEVSGLVQAARWAADRDGLPGTMRDRLHQPRPVMAPAWTVLSADRNNKPTERVWTLPRLGPWAGHAVWDYCSQGRGGRYALYRRLPPARGHDGSRTGDSTYEPTGIRFATQAALLAWLAENPPTAV